LKFSSFSCINYHRQITFLFRNNKYAHFQEFDVSRLFILIEMLMTRVGVIGLE